MIRLCCGLGLLGVRIRKTLGDIDPLNKVPFKRATSGVQKGSPLKKGPLILPPSFETVDFRDPRL